MKDEDKAAMLQRFYKPRPVNEKVQSRKEKFDALNRYISARHGWITSIPGDRTVTVECLENSALPDELRDLGYVLTAAGTGERILPTAIVEHVIVEGSSGVRRPVQHAGICRVLKFSFELP